jgi:hypothetical protein
MLVFHCHDDDAARLRLLGDARPPRSVVTSSGASCEL